MAARRLDQVHRAGLLRDLRALRLETQPRRRADGHERVLPRRRGAAGRRGLARHRHQRGGCGGQAAPVRRAQRRCVRGGRERGAEAAHPLAAVAAPRPRRDHGDRRGAAHAQRQEVRGAGQAHPRRRSAGESGQPGRVEESGVDAAFPRQRGVALTSPTAGEPQRWSAATEHPDMWVDSDEDPRDTGTELVDERGTLNEYLRAYRITLQMKCAGLDAAQLAQRSVPPSTMSLLGLVRHLAEVERYWFRVVMAGEAAAKLYSPDGQRDGDWLGAVVDDDVVAQAWSQWRAEVTLAEQLVDEAPDLDVMGTMRDGQSIRLREVLVHMIEEYARHCGHADLLRECIDGRVGQ